MSKGMHLLNIVFSGSIRSSTRKAKSLLPCIAWLSAVEVGSLSMAKFLGLSLEFSFGLRGNGLLNLVLTLRGRLTDAWAPLAGVDGGRFAESERALLSGSTRVAVCSFSV